MFEHRVYFIGLRYSHHARHSGYEALGAMSGPRSSPRYAFAGCMKYRWALSERFARLTRHPCIGDYAYPMSGAALKQMLGRKRHSSMCSTPT